VGGCNHRWSLNNWSRRALYPRMKNALRKLVLVAVLGSGAAFAQVQVSASVNIPLPTIHFEAPPPLVVVQPGVQVVRDYDDEVYFSNGYYWVRRDKGWFRARDDRRWAWSPVDVRYVPPALYQMPVGHYRRWHPAAEPVPVGFRAAPPPAYQPAPPPPVYQPAPVPPPPGYVDRHEEHEREKAWKHREHEREKELRREEKANREEDRREWKEHEREERREWKDHDRDDHRPAGRGDHDEHDRDHDHGHD
jgi:hypothetical protein